MVELLTLVFTLGYNWLIKFLKRTSKEIKKASTSVYMCVFVCVLSIISTCIRIVVELLNKFNSISKESCV